MYSILSAAHYTSPEIVAQENARIFRRLWILAGFRTLLSKPDAFLTRTIGGVPVVVQNCGGELRGFINQCAHRQAPLQLGDYGHRRLACPYHGWTYNDDGRVKTVPGCDANYGFTAKIVEGLGLRRVAVRCVGGLVFVNLDIEPLPIEAQFHAEYLARLEEVSQYADDQGIFAKFRGQYNWKLNFENVLDYNHVPFVHASTFARMIPALRPELGGTVERSLPPPSDFEISGEIRDLSYETQSAFDFPSWPWHDRVERFSDTSTYYNFFIYPNVNFISLAATTFLTQQFSPVSAGETEISLTMTIARKRKRLPALPAILWSHLKSEKRVIDEDIAVLEALQRGLFDDGLPAVHGSCETRLRAVAKVYSHLLAD
jgi:phenylpropionate dioxygenase-like ring-hydroxylating dioxygenase large terminal subunit